MQSRVMSAVEAVVNIAIGFLVSVAANIIVLPLFGYDVTVADSFAIGWPLLRSALFDLTRCAEYLTGSGARWQAHKPSRLIRSASCST